MNATRTPRNQQLSMEINDVPDAVEIAGSPAVVDPWETGRTHRTLESVIDSASMLSGLEISPARTPVRFRQPMTTRQRNFLFALAREQGWSADDVHAEAVERFHVESVNDLDRWQVSELIRMLQEHPAMPVAS